MFTWKWPRHYLASAMEDMGTQSGSNEGSASEEEETDVLCMTILTHIVALNRHYNKVTRFHMHKCIPCNTQLQNDTGIGYAKHLIHVSCYTVHSVGSQHSHSNDLATGSTTHTA